MHVYDHCYVEQACRRAEGPHVGHSGLADIVYRQTCIGSMNAKSREILPILVIRMYITVRGYREPVLLGHNLRYACLYFLVLNNVNKSNHLHTVSHKGGN